MELGEPPYSSITKNRDVVEYVLSGKRLAKPVKCPEIVFDWMQKCWLEDPRERPSFKTLLMELDKFYMVAFTNQPGRELRSVRSYYHNGPNVPEVEVNVLRGSHYEVPRTMSLYGLTNVDE